MLVVLSAAFLNRLPSNYDAIERAFDQRVLQNVTRKPTLTPTASPTNPTYWSIIDASKTHVEGKAPWLTNAVQPTLSTCQSLCLSLHSCHYGTFISGGPRAGQCWLAATKHSPLRQQRCGALCTSFRKQANSSTSALRVRILAKPRPVVPTTGSPTPLPPSPFPTTSPTFMDIDSLYLCKCLQFDSDSLECGGQYVRAGKRDGRYVYKRQHGANATLAFSLPLQAWVLKFSGWTSDPFCLTAKSTAVDPLNLGTVANPNAHWMRYAHTKSEEGVAPVAVTCCERNRVTPRPTSLPTTSPTTVPTTTFPTKAPTAPTPSPSSAPTFVPTSVPTVIPTPDPSAIPTVVPTAIPTRAPTAAPTEPTTSPTLSLDQDFKVRQALSVMTHKLKGFLAQRDWVLDKGATPAPTKAPDIFRMPPEQASQLMVCDSNLGLCNTCIACRQRSHGSDQMEWEWRCDQVRNFCCHSIIRNGLACYDCAKHALAMLKFPVLKEKSKIPGCEVLPKYV
jgi:hypothetical protein